MAPAVRGDIAEQQAADKLTQQRIAAAKQAAKDAEAARKAIQVTRKTNTARR
ncbi:hypothetical protein ACWGDX_13270 [Streptomyces sp. NPDC055025]